MNREHIYPTCPNCDNKASDGEGVKLMEIQKDGTFKWTCSSCLVRHTGTFSPDKSSIHWKESEVTAKRRVKQLIPFI